MKALRLPTIIACLARAEEHRDFGTNSHARRVAIMMYRLAQQVGLPKAESRQIASAAVLHDIGKLAVPIDLLQKSTPLSAEELALIRTHSNVGYEILTTRETSKLSVAADIALHHHERYDGTGYPEGLSGDAIPLPSQLAAICDVYDALRQDRPYRRGLSHVEAMGVVVNGDARTKPTHFSPRVSSAFQIIADQAKTIFDYPAKFVASSGA